MADLLIHPQAPDKSGRLHLISSGQAGWDYLNIEVFRLKKGQRHVGVQHGIESVWVILSGQCHFHSDKQDFGVIGRRPDVFGGMPWAVYLSRNSRYTIEGVSDDCEIARCFVPSEVDFPARLITPPDVTIEIRGGGTATRQINSILPPGFPCQRLVCVEVYTPPGHWSSYPPHKHDVHRVDEAGQVIEADLEEIYFYKVSPADGFAYQRVYTGDGRLDALMMPRHNDVVLVPEGYHPVASPPGYTTYYLNFLAGSAQSLANMDDPQFAWVKGAWGEPDPRLPLVTHAMEKTFEPRTQSPKVRREGHEENKGTL